MADDEITIKEDAFVPTVSEKDATVHVENIAHRGRLEARYRRPGDSTSTPVADLDAIYGFIQEMSAERATEILLRTKEDHYGDPNFPEETMMEIDHLLLGAKVADMDADEWDFDIRMIACVIYYHSPYPEVRSVTEPFDDPSIPVETIRAYLLGLILMVGSTALNTFFNPRQPSISLSALVMQLILAPCGKFLAKVLPDWGVTLRGRRISLNPGPWTLKEQLFATIMFSVGNNAGATYYTYIVQKLPQYLDQNWVSFGYEITLALYAQMAGLGFAGILRPFVVYPKETIWPKVLPTLALNRALVLDQSKQKGQVVNGWRITTYHFFLLTASLMFIWFWVPNKFFTALHGFNWMTWIAPQNIKLAVVTGFYGGMGYSPWTTFDWNVAGTNYLVTPFFATVQQYSGRFVSGIVIIAMYFGNYCWTSYMPINSNETFDRYGKEYNISRILGSDMFVKAEAYKEYGPPYYSAANVFGQGNLLAWYMLTLTYVPIRSWNVIKRAGRHFWHLATHRTADDDERFEDSHTRQMRAYKEVPWWWFMIILVVGTACGIVALSVWPSRTPWWSLIVMMILSLVFLLPTTLITATTNTGCSLDILFKVLTGVWFAGDPMALIVLEAVAPQFDAQADTYVTQLKIGHYAKLPPRAVFRAQILSVFLNCFIFISVLNWMITTYDASGTLCEWNNPQHFVCYLAVQNFSSAVMYGAFGVRNMYYLYPWTGWSLLLGSVIGIAFGVGQRYGPPLVDKWRLNWQPERFDRWDRWLFRWTRWLYWINPSVIWSGACGTWSGGGNISYHTQGLYCSIIFMYHIKRRYPAWWEKYNYLLEAGFDVGVALAGLVITLAFAFGGAQFPSWWGNTVATAGVDYQQYNQKAPLLTVPENPGYFGLNPDQFPMFYPQDILDGSKGGMA